jgi:hypothetical protein
MKLSAGSATAVAAGVIVVATTYLHGRMTDRWTGRNVTGELRKAAALLEERFPRAAGEWAAAEEIPTDPQELERAGAVGYVSRSYRHGTAGVPPVAAFIVCATPHEASGHTPDRCYPGAGFEIGETEHRETFKLADGRRAEAFSGTFRKSGQTLRVFWTYGVNGNWVAPQIARIELADAAAVYKLYAIVDETAVPAGDGSRACTNFLQQILPLFDAALASSADVPAESAQEAAEPAS